ncbi:MAG: CCA tRNA nucleotidyltransferase, partial [Bacillota bacterium]
MSEAPEIRNKPACKREDAAAVLRRLREAGHVAYFAGGCVRDVLLGLEPKDYDVATDAPPKRVRQLFTNTQAVGAAFGVILVRHGRSVVEVATFRSDEQYVDGRRPSGVRFTTAEEDAQRRDFTINGLFMDPLEKDRVIDYVGGLEDLKIKRLRAIGDPAKRFAEDHLRLLRAVRFAARFGLEIEGSTAAAILRDAPLLKRISPERIADELRLMLTPPTRGHAWEMLWHFRLVEVVYRFLPMGSGIPFDPRRSIFLTLGAGRGISFGLALAAGTLCVKWQGMKEGED